MSEFNKQIRQYYAEQSMNEEKLETILETGRQVVPVPRWRRYSLVAAAAAVLIASALFFMSNNSRMSRDVILELAENHMDNTAGGYVVSEYYQAQSSLNLLDFSIFPAGDFMPDKFNIIKTRYCNIQGELAAQIDLKDKKTGQPCTLFVSRVPSDLSGIKDGWQRRGRVEVMIWIEGDRFFAMARTAGS